MATPPTQSSSLLLDEHWNAADPRFLEELLALSDSALLLAMADKLIKDPRPFARSMLERYVDEGCDRAGHRALVKRLFKHAERTANDLMMARFLVAFDRLPAWELRAPRRGAPGGLPTWKTARGVDVRARMGDVRTFKRPHKPDVKYHYRTANARFSLATRMHLKRRVWRYFRVLGFRDVARYRAALLHALPRYQEADVARVDLLLGCWGLVHALFGKSDVVDHKPAHLRVRQGRLLKDLTPAPLHPAAWQQAATELMTLAASAHARTVRVWAMDLLKRDHAARLEGLDSSSLQALLTSPHEEVVLFGVGLLAKARGLDAAPVDWWITLLKIPSLEVSGMVAGLVEKHVSPQRVTLPQCVELARLSLAPVAELGARWIKSKTRPTPAELSVIVPALDAPVLGVRTLLTPWVCAALQKDEVTPLLLVRELVDNRHEDVRTHALQLMEQTPRFSASTDLWAAMTETPFSDVRTALLRVLDDHAAQLTPGSLRHLWATVLLDVNRGSRRKPLAIRQLVDRMAGHPAEATSLFPLVRVALRSLRAPERRHALAAVGQLLFRHPEHVGTAAALIPELKLLDGGAA